MLLIYDMTLRDKAQGQLLSSSEKVQIVRELDRLGLPFIEGGCPGTNPKDVQFFWQLKEEPLTQAEIVAFCSTRRPGITAAEDPMLQPVLSAGTRWITVFGKSWDLHVIKRLQTTLEENLDMIQDTIAYFRSQDRRIIYNAQHWFDGYKQNRDYALKTLAAAIAGGAEWLVLCDTNGEALPHEVTKVVRDVTDYIELNHLASCLPQFGIHARNNSETAVANAIAAVLEGARMIQGTINGNGERCGNANICSLLPNFQVKMGYSCVRPDQLAHLSESSRLISEIINGDRASFVALSSYAPKSNIRGSAVKLEAI